MIVELLKPWRRWDAGHRLEKTDGAADMLIQRGIAKAIKGPESNQTAKPKRSAKKAPRAAKSIGPTKRTAKKATQ